MSAASDLEQANPRDLPMPLLAVCGAAAAVGVLAFFIGLATDATTTWRAFHVNFVYFAGLSQAGLVLASAFVIIGAKWPGPIRHVAAGLAAWVPVTLVLAVASYFGREAIFIEWIHGPPPGKEAWLNYPRLYFMDLSILAVLTFLTLRFLRASLRPTLHGVGEGSPARNLFQGWSSNWRGERVERAESDRQLKALAPGICLLYAIGYGFFGVDQVMTLTPTFFSTMFFWYFAWGGFLCAVAATALVCVLLRRTEGWEDEITPARMHDLGKMIFAFSVFWMYLFFAQYIVIWYGNLPEETQFYSLRLGSQFLQDTWFFMSDRIDEPYVKLSLAAWLGCWIIPFWVLLGQRPKRTPAILGTVSAIVLAGFWLERNALIWPSLVPDDGSAWIGPIQIGVAVGFFGAFALVFLIFSRIFPTLPLPRRS